MLIDKSLLKNYFLKSIVNKYINTIVGFIKY